MKQFEIGKTYALRVSLFNGEGKKSIGIEGYTVVKRSKCYATFTKTDCYSVSDGNTERTKIFVDQDLGHYANVSFMTNDYLYAMDEISPDTIGIYDEADCPIQPHDAPDENATHSQPEIIKFIVGKTYVNDFAQLTRGWGDAHPYTRHYITHFTIIARGNKYVTVRAETGCNKGKISKRTLHVSDDNVEFITPEGTYGARRRNFMFANAQTVELKIPAPTEIAPETVTTTHAPDDTPETLYLDCEECFSDFAGDNSAPLQDIPDDRVAVHGKPQFPLVPYFDEFLAPQTLPHSRRKPRKHIRFEVSKTYSAFHDGKSLHIRIIKRMKKNATQTSQNIHLNVWGYDALTGGQIPNDGKI